MDLAQLSPAARWASVALCVLPGVAAFKLDKPAVNLPKPIASAEVIALGKALFHEKGLSNPAGQACVSCHDQSTGYTFPDSKINEQHGVAPGATAGRFGSRKPPSVAYAPFMRSGIPVYDKTAIAWVGGMFWDGRAKDARDQVHFPLFDPNEMNNQLHNVGQPQMLAKKLKSGPLAPLFIRAYGANVFSLKPEQLMDKLAEAIVAYEASPEVSPFTSKYDAYLEGKATLTPEELLGMRLTTGSLSGRPGALPFRKSAHCTDCHGLSNDLKNGPDLWTNS